MALEVRKPVEISQMQQRPRIVRIADPDAETAPGPEREAGEAAAGRVADDEGDDETEGADSGLGIEKPAEAGGLENAAGNIEFPAAFSSPPLGTRNEEIPGTRNPGQIIEFKRPAQTAAKSAKPAGKLSDLLAGKWTHKTGKPPWPTGLYEINPKGRAVTFGAGKSARTVTGFQYMRRVVCPACGDRRTRVAAYVKPSVVAEMQQLSREERQRNAAFKLLADWRKPLPDDLRCAGCIAGNQGESGKAG